MEERLGLGFLSINQTDKTQDQINMNSFSNQAKDFRLETNIKTRCRRIKMYCFVKIVTWTWSVQNDLKLIENRDLLQLQVQEFLLR